MVFLERDRFREALIERMDLTGISATELARRSGVSKATIDKLRQRRVEVTNIHDAILLARVFQQNVEDFMGVSKNAQKQAEVVSLFASLPESLRETMLVQLRALVQARGVSGPRKKGTADTGARPDAEEPAERHE